MSCTLIFCYNDDIQLHRGIFMETSYHAAVIMTDSSAAEPDSEDSVRALKKYLPAPGTSSFFCTAPGCIVLLLYPDSLLDHHA